VLYHGDLIYQSVRHSFDYFDYTELPLTISIPDTEGFCLAPLVNLSGFINFPDSCVDFLRFPDAVSVACQNPLGCRVTVKQTTVAVFERDVAQRYLSVPPTSVPSERLFSSAGLLDTDRRNRLLPERSEQLLFTKHNLDVDS